MVARSFSDGKTEKLKVTGFHHYESYLVREWKYG